MTAVPEFEAPLPISGTNRIQNRLSLYINNICNDLDHHESHKTPLKNCMLKFYENTPLLDKKLARKFSNMILAMLKQQQNLNSVDSTKFGRVIKLLENTVIISTELDLVEHYEQNKKPAEVFSLLELISEGLEMCDILFDLLTSWKLGKEFISRSLVTHCLHFIKNQLDFLVYPFIDLTGLEHDEVTSVNATTRRLYALIESSTKERKIVSTLIPGITRFLRRVFQLIQHEDLDDDVLVTVAYISVAPFFHEYSEQTACIVLNENSEEGTVSSYEHLKLSTLQILKHIFSMYPQHRLWIFEEILTSLGSLSVMSEKKNYRVRDNKSIHIISVLFMELVQSSATLSNKSIHKNWFSKWSIKYQKAQDSNKSENIKLLNDQLLTRAVTAWKASAESAANSASFFLEFLLSKCKTKNKDMYSVTEYRRLLVNTLEDIMSVFNDPAWPVAELIIKVFSRILISVLETNRSDQYLKSLAIEWLGIIACRIKLSQYVLSGQTNSYTPEWVYDINEKLPVCIEKTTPIEAIELVNQCRKKLIENAAEERISTSVMQFYFCQWGFTESVIWLKANKGWKVEKTSEKNANKENVNVGTEENIEDENMETDVIGEKEELEPTEEERWPLNVVELLQGTCKYYWQICLGFESSLPKFNKLYVFPELDGPEELSSLVELLASRQTLYTSYDFILSELLMCLNKEGSNYRVKSLKAIGKIVSQVPEVFEDRIRLSVVHRVHDASPSVRDAAVEVLAKYLGRQQDVSYKLYELVSGRITDISASVRKRLVKLLSELYFKFSDINVKKDIAAKLIMRIGDNEVTISQLSLKATRDTLFLPFKEIEKDGNDYFGYSYANAPKERKRRINDLTDIIVGAVAKLDSSLTTQNFALSQIVQKTMNEIEGKSKEWHEKIFQWIIDSLFDRMIQLDEENNNEEFISCIAIVHSFAKSCPNLLRSTHISMLQPYLTISENDDWTKASYVLMIYRDVLPKRKHHDRDTIELLERILLQLLTKCPLEMTASGASCLCVIVSQISRRYNILIKILGSCVTKLKQTRDAISYGKLSEGILSGVLKMILLCGLLCQYFEFDKRRQEEPVAMGALDLVYRGEIGILIYDLLKFFTGDLEELKKQGMAVRMAALQGLGYFYSSYPTFMISEESTQLMDNIFKEGTPSLKTQLMHVFKEFLGSEDWRIEKREEEEEKTGQEKRIEIDTLLGNTKEYAELGVNGSLMQRYLPKILECGLDNHNELRYAAFEVVSSIINRGLAHPVLCMATIVAAETSPDTTLRTKAYYIHKYTHDKYGPLLYIQMDEYISTSFKYQSLLFGNKVKGFGERGGDSKVESVLSLSYSVLKEHKKSKFDFLHALVKPFSFELNTTSPEDIDIKFQKYLAENIMMLDFTETNEVLFIIYHIDRLLCSLGAELLSFVQFLRKQGRMIEQEDVDIDNVQEDFITASKLSVGLCIAMLLKKLLIELYDIPDEEVREYNPNRKQQSRDVVKDIEMSQSIDWEEELIYFQYDRIDQQTGIQACMKFEYLIISDSTVLVTSNTK